MTTPYPPPSVALLILGKLAEDARELPFEQAATDFEGIAGLLAGNVELRIYREALESILAGVDALNRLRAQVAEMNR